MFLSIAYMCYFGKGRASSFLVFSKAAHLERGRLRRLTSTSSFRN